MPDIGPQLLVAISDSKSSTVAKGNVPSPPLEVRRLQRFPGGYSQAVTNARHNPAKYVSLEFHSRTNRRENRTGHSSEDTAAARVDRSSTISLYGHNPRMPRHHVAFQQRLPPLPQRLQQIRHPDPAILFRTSRQILTRSSINEHAPITFPVE